MAAAYADLGKKAKSVLTDGYNGHLAKLNVNHGLPGNVTVTTTAALDTQDTEAAVAMDLATKLTSPDQGVTVVDKRGINAQRVGTHSLTATVKDLCDVKNLIFTADHSGKLNLAYKNDFVNESVDYLQDTNTLKPTVCLSKDAFAAGMMTSIPFGANEPGPEATAVAAGYLGKSIQGHVHADNDFTKVGASLWGTHGKFEGAVMGSQVLESGKTTAQLGVRVNIDKELSVGAKVDTNQDVAINAKKKFQNNLALSSSVIVPIQNLDNVQLGAGLDFSHNFEFLDKIANGNISSNNSARAQRMTLLAPTKHRKQRIGATSKELGENCVDGKCKPVKKPWE